MSFSVFVRPSSRADVDGHAIAAALQSWTGKQVFRIDFVDAANGAFYCFAHFNASCEEMQAVTSILGQQQVILHTANEGWIIVGQNKSGGYDPTSPDRTSHLIFAEGETFFVYRENWVCFMWCDFEESWVPSDIMLVASHVPNMPETELSANITKFIDGVFDRIVESKPQVATEGEAVPETQSSPEVTEGEAVPETQSPPEVTEDEAVANPVRRKKTKRFMKTPLEIALLKHIFA